MGAIRLFLALVVAIGHLQIKRAQSRRSRSAKLLHARHERRICRDVLLYDQRLSDEHGAPRKISGDHGRDAQLLSKPLHPHFTRCIGQRCFCCFFFTYNFWGWFAALSVGDKLTNLFIVGMDWRIVFADYPAWHWDASLPFLHQAWTLGAELTFYIVAPFILRSWKVALSVLVAGATIRGILVATTVFDGRWTYMFLPSTLMFFLIGHFAQVISKQWTVLKTGRCGALMLGLCLACLLKWTVNWDTPKFYIVAFCFAAAIPGIF